MFHVQLRQFPHQAQVFNLGQDQLDAIVVPWLDGRVVDVGGQKWAPERATLMILEGPELATHQLAMGRGWSAARKGANDITASYLAAHAPTPMATQAMEPLPRTLEPAPGRATGPTVDGPEYDELKRELLERSARELLSLHEAWRLAATWFPSARVGERLEATDAVVRRLLSDGTVQLCRGRREVASEHPVPARDADPLLNSVDTWAEREDPSVFLRARN
jgi:hypothetical protein